MNCKNFDFYSISHAITFSEPSNLPFGLHAPRTLTIDRSDGPLSGPERSAGDRYFSLYRTLSLLNRVPAFDTNDEHMS